MLVRAQAPEELVSTGVKAKLMIPSPEELGIGSAANATSRTRPAEDWSVARHELDTLGATSYRLEKAAEGGFRFHCAFAHAEEPSRQRNFESRASTETEAIRLALQQIEAWKAAQK